MGFLITLGVVFLMAWVIVGTFVYMDDPWSGVIGSAFMGFLGGLIASGVTVLVIGLFVGTFPESEQAVYEEVEISALKDNSETSGSFFLGTGTVDEEQRHFYVVEDELGKHVEDVAVNKSYIKEVSGEVTPKLVTYDQRYTGEFARWYFGDWKMSSSIEYQFVVPEGSVTTEFNIDLE